VSAILRKREDSLFLPQLQQQEQQQQPQQSQNRHEVELSQLRYDKILFHTYSYLRPMMLMLMIDDELPIVNLAHSWNQLLTGIIFLAKFRCRSKECHVSTIFKITDDAQNSHLVSILMTKNSVVVECTQQNSSLCLSPA
jgi:hypothetical protein